VSAGSGILAAAAVLVATAVVLRRFATSAVVTRALVAWHPSFAVTFVADETVVAVDLGQEQFAAAVLVVATRPQPSSYPVREAAVPVRAVVAASVGLEQVFVVVDIVTSVVLVEVLGVGVGEPAEIAERHAAAVVVLVVAVEAGLTFVVADVVVAAADLHIVAVAAAVVRSTLVVVVVGAESYQVAA
jgi:hypothetical protein